MLNYSPKSAKKLKIDAVPSIDVVFSIFIIILEKNYNGLRCDLQIVLMNLIGIE